MSRQCSRPTTSGKRERVLTCRRALASLLLAGLQACALLPQPEIFEPTAATPAGLAMPVAGSFEIGQAELILYTYRAGWLKNLAHGHVMTTSAIDGSVTLTEPIYDSTATLYFRPWDLILDEPAARAAAGSGFESERSAEDIAATRTRMLGPRGFHSNEYPFVVVDVRWVNEARVGLSIRFREAAIELEVPVTWSSDADLLHVQADFELSHRGLGIAPYSAFVGAIAVADPIRVQLRLSATRTTPI